LLHRKDTARKDSAVRVSLSSIHLSNSPERRRPISGASEDPPKPNTSDNNRKLFHQHKLKGFKDAPSRRGGRRTV
jgi:hypothetical protein